MKDLNYYLSKIRTKEDAVHILMTMCCDCDRRIACIGAESDLCNSIKEAIVNLYKDDSTVHKTDSNKILHTEEVSSFFVIIADRDGVRKYVSKAFPRIFQYTVQMTKAQRFYSREAAQKFIDGFNNYGKYVIDKPEIREVQRQFKLL